MSKRIYPGITCMIGLVAITALISSCGSSAELPETLFSSQQPLTENVGRTGLNEEDCDLGQKVSFEQIQLQNTLAPPLEKTPAAIKTLDYDGLHFILYRPDGEKTYYHLAVNTSNKVFDLGRVGYGNADWYENSIVQKTWISSQNTIYALTRTEDLDLIQNDIFHHSG